MNDLNALFGSAYIATDDGQFISAEHERIARIIKDYDPQLELAWIPPSKREPGDKPFAVIARPVGAPTYVVCYADECDERLLARVFSMDMAKNDVWDDLELNRAAREAIKMRKDLDEREEAMDLTKSIIKSPLHVFKHNGVRYE